MRKEKHRTAYGNLLLIIIGEKVRNENKIKNESFSVLPLLCLRWLKRKAKQKAAVAAGVEWKICFAFHLTLFPFFRKSTASKQAQT
jgi:hypothetical protein